MLFALPCRAIDASHVLQRQQQTVLQKPSRNGHTLAFCSLKPPTKQTDPPARLHRPSDDESINTSFESTKPKP